MDNIKPWQIVIFVLAIGALGFSVWKFGIGSSAEKQLASSLTLMDVETGQLYLADIRGSRTLLIPAPRPDTDLQALIPVYEENEEWFLFERYRGALNTVAVPPTAVPDPNGPVQVLDASKIKFN